jgi:1,4-dihydroxy-2-naphthoyl-CoA synthase
MERWGLVNAVVPPDRLRATVREWADELLSTGPTALKVLKHSFNVDSESMGAVGALAFEAS